MDNNNIPRLLLDFIITARGICHENALILALINLKKDFEEFDPSWSIQKWISELNENIDRINIKLSTLNYKIVRINHGMGKKSITLPNQINGSEANSMLDADVENISNKFYVYINMQSTDETKLATRFQEREISFIKWAIDQFVNHAMTINSIQNNNDIESNIIYKETNTLLSSLSQQKDDDNNEESDIRWKQFITFTSRSTKLLQYDNMGATEVESLLIQLCGLKWFYRDSNGRFGMDLRCLAELQDYLINEFELPSCQYCHQLTIQGVMCGNNNCHAADTEELNSIFQRRVWHLDCFQHYMQHVSQKCDKCQNPLLQNSVYII